jgi:hypothetical protein
VDFFLYSDMEKPKNAVEALIGILRSPIAQRRGWSFDAYDCAAWADELEEFLKHTKYEKH